jgi:NAD(P)-dependent dehydrogenase (short-subunit alcohol dehydrogenase family)
MGRLADKVALITGAGAGIGRASARLFASEGAQVVIAELSAESGASLEAELRAAGAEVLFVETDVTSEDSVRRAVAAGVERFGQLDVLFCCAGGSLASDGPVTEVDMDVWEHTLALDLRGTFLSCRHAIPEMTRSGGGSIVNTSSIVALDGSAPLHVYASAKGGVISLTRSLAGRYAADGIRANVICPGMVLTERILERFPDAAAGRSPIGGIDPATHPFAIGVPEDIARIALFLASDESRMINAAVIPAEGGLSAY